VFGYGPPIAFGFYRSDRRHPDHLEQIADRAASGSLVRVAAALRGPDLSPFATCLDDIRRARDRGLIMSMHIGTRATGSGGVSSLVEAGVLGEDMHFIHATDSSREELLAMAESGATLVIPPIAELVMGTGSPPFRRAAQVGLDVALGVDTVLGGPASMFEQMRAALQCLRDDAWDGLRPPLRSTCRDVLVSATLNGARACGLASETGSLAVGKSADLLVLQPPSTPLSIDQAYAQVVWTGHPSRIRSVFVAGHELISSTDEDKESRGE
jgi:cytosine/adenosine deaminase-related metal-dependent hydrolase